MPLDYKSITKQKNQGRNSKKQSQDENMQLLKLQKFQSDTPPTKKEAGSQEQKTEKSQKSTKFKVKASIISSLKQV
jgi:hypothetical protein